MDFQILNLRKTNIVIILFLAFLVFSTNLFAQIQGQWKGTGHWNYQGSGSYCPKVIIQFSENEKELVREAGSLICEIVSLEMQPLTLTKNGSDLYIDGKKVGTIDTNLYTWTEEYSDKVKINVTIKKENNLLKYTEIWIDSKNLPLYDIKATLKL